LLAAQGPGDVAGVVGVGVGVVQSSQVAASSVIAAHGWWNRGRDASARVMWLAWSSGGRAHVGDDTPGAICRLVSAQ